MDVDADLRSITGAEISAVTLHYDVDLQLIDPKDPLRLDAWLKLGVPFTYATSSGSTEIDPEVASTLEPCWRLLRKQITSAVADDDLNLTIDLSDGSRIAIARSLLYEAWELRGKGVNGVLAGPI